MPESFQEWCLVELMGHNRIVGQVSEATLAGGAFLRVDVPPVDGNKAFTRFYSPSSIYAISPIGETEARALVERFGSSMQPVSRFELPQIAEKVKTDGDGYNGAGERSHTGEEFD